MYLIKHLEKDKYIDENGEFSDFEYAHRFETQKDATNYIFHSGWEDPITVIEE